jgi:hypothetical protein
MEKFIDKMCQIVYFGGRRDYFKTSLANAMHVEKDRK